MSVTWQLMLTWLLLKAKAAARIPRGTSGLSALIRPAALASRKVWFQTRSVWNPSIHACMHYHCFSRSQGGRDAGDYPSCHREKVGYKFIPGQFKVTNQTNLHVFGLARGSQSTWRKTMQAQREHVPSPFAHVLLIYLITLWILFVFF